MGKRLVRAPIGTKLAAGSRVTREVASHGNAVAGLPYDAERGCALTVRLLRAPVLLATGQDWLEEACAGMIDDGEAAHTSMGREAREELGLECGAVEAIGTVWSIPGVSTERVSLFLIPYRLAQRVGPGGGLVSEHEGITVVERSLRSLLADADAGNITDGKLLTLVLALRRRHAHVFEPR